MYCHINNNYNNSLSCHVMSKVSIEKDCPYPTCVSWTHWMSQTRDRLVIIIIIIVMLTKDLCCYFCGIIMWFYMMRPERLLLGKLLLIIWGVMHYRLIYYYRLYAHLNFLSFFLYPTGVMNCFLVSTSWTQLW